MLGFLCWGAIYGFTITSNSALFIGESALFIGECGLQAAACRSAESSHLFTDVLLVAADVAFPSLDGVIVADPDLLGNLFTSQVVTSSS